MKLSLMTMNLFNELSSKYQVDQDMEKFIDGYQKMMELIAESGYQAIDVTANEVELIKAEKLIEITSSLQVKISSFIYIEQFTAMDQEGDEERIRKAKHAVDVAASLGTKVCPGVHAGVVESVPAALRAITGNGVNVLAMGAFYVAPAMGCDIADAYLGASLGTGYEWWENFYEFHKLAIDELEAFDYEKYKADGFRVRHLGDYPLRLETKPD